MENLNKFNKIICNLFKITEDEMEDNLSPDDIIVWDSLTYIELIDKLDKTFNISIKMSDVSRMDSIGNIKNILIDYGIIF